MASTKQEAEELKAKFEGTGAKMRIVNNSETIPRQSRAENLDASIPRQRRLPGGGGGGMMAKKQTNIRTSRSTRAKLIELAGRYGTQAEAVAVAIDRLHQQETGENEMKQQERYETVEKTARKFAGQSAALDGAMVQLGNAIGASDDVYDAILDDVYDAIDELLSISD